jgi:hypothetical protein
MVGQRTVPADDAQWTGRSPACAISVGLDAPPDVVEALRPPAMGGSFFNVLRYTGWRRLAYTRAYYVRLQRLKTTFDPGNLFGAHHTIRRLRKAGA